MSTNAVNSDTDVHLLPCLDDNIAMIQSALGGSPDLIVKGFKWGDQWRAALLFIDGMVDATQMHEMIVEPLLSLRKDDVPFEPSPGIDALHALKDHVLSAANVSVVDQPALLFNSMFSGDAVLLLDGSASALRIDVFGIEERPVGEPITQSVIRGPMEAFTENYRKNVVLIRRRIKDPNLWIESRLIGKVTKTQVGIMYLRNVADDKIVQEVRQRLDRIDIDGILESGYIEELIQDRTITPFPTLNNSERPDAVAAALLEGRVAIVVDGTPFVLTVPGLFVHFFQSVEDYYQRADIGTLLRVIRFISFFIAMLAPSFYIAVSTFHQEMLPTGLLINLAAQREGVPFPAFIEALLMEVTYEILREAGVRMPRTVGQAVSIVGTLVIGQAAVDAGIVSAAMVIIVSITAIASYVIPTANMSITVRMIRFVLMGLSASFGMYGMLIGIIGMVVHLCTLRSFGVPYMLPFGPFVMSDQKDTLFRLPWSRMIMRPSLMNHENPRRQRKKPAASKGE
ncbi:spore germination protein [Paenibacillus mendelii]|uniref:Spore germination protein n=1 Tax=Paenibacillus mendelii TaxID=206163 RepID=A0ABV6J8I9_9BACL|nr:spore germination protein [Paenibacillus mendelii]MCQ6559505.1 spore germination protein [Paenibacillus mendelii]